jgi:hypothetical protein
MPDTKTTSRGGENGVTLEENCLALFYKVKYAFTIWSAVVVLGIYPRDMNMYAHTELNLNHLPTRNNSKVNLLWINWLSYVKGLLISSEKGAICWHA